MGKNMHYAVDGGKIGRLVIDCQDKKANVIDVPFLEELSALLDEIKDVKALVITSAKDGVFIAGADLHGFKPAFENEALGSKLIGLGHSTFTKLSKLPFPTIAAINGACLGGGTELALACTYRVISDNPKTQIGLPEVSLGLFPGWGGTQRAPRLVGLLQGLKLILGAKPVDGRTAFKIHLADAIVASEFFNEGVESFVAKILTDKGKESVQKARKTPFFDKTVIGPMFAFWKAKRDTLQKTAGHYPAPLAALEVIKKGFYLPLDKALDVEKKAFVKSTPQAKKIALNLIQLFFNSESLKKHPGVPIGAEGKDVKSLGVIGAGTMGSGIAWLSSYRDVPVQFKDINWEMIGNGYGSAWKSYLDLIKIRKLKPDAALLKFHKMSGTTDYSGFKRVDLVVEAATENLELKYKIFKELEDVLPENSIIASNTSSLTISELAKSSKNPERFVGMHFFNPVPRMPLVEVVAGEKTSPQAIATAVAFCQKMKKSPIVVKDTAGFLVNRIFVMGVVEVMNLLEEGVPQEKIAKALLDFGMPMDPFELADEVGNDVNYKVLESFSKAYPDRVIIPSIVKKVYEKGLFGKKVGKGFYLYSNRKKGKKNPEIQALLGDISVKSVDSQEIVDRLTLGMLAESARCLEEGIVNSPGHLDMALVLGTGFPPFRTGILRYADQQGIDVCVKKMQALEKSHGARYRPCKLLLDMRDAGKTFYTQ